MIKQEPTSLIVLAVPTQTALGLRAPKSGNMQSLGKEENEGLFRTSTVDPEKCISIKDGTQIAIFSDGEKDRTDPDYDRSYERYVRSLPTNRTFNVAPFNYMQKVQLSFVQYDTGFPQVGARVNYWPPASPVMSPLCSVGSNLTTDAATYTQWPSAATIYAHSYEQFRHAVFQAPFCQQPLSFDYSQNH